MTVTMINREILSRLKPISIVSFFWFVENPQPGFGKSTPRLS